MSNLEDEFEAAEDSDCEDEASQPCPRSTEHPERGIFPTTKKFLIEKLDAAGGINCITRENRLLESICNEHPDKLGTEDSELRKRVRVCAYHWKRNAKLCTNARKRAAKTKDDDDDVKPRSVSESVTAPRTATLPPPLPPVVSHPTPIVSPPAIKRSVAKMFSPNRKKSKSDPGFLTPSGNASVANVLLLSFE